MKRFDEWLETPGTPPTVLLITNVIGTLAAFICVSVGLFHLLF